MGTHSFHRTNMGKKLVTLLVFFLFLDFYTKGAKILTHSSLGGSHYLLMDQVSQILQDHGHNVTMLSTEGTDLIPDFLKKGQSYHRIQWIPPEDFLEELKKVVKTYFTEILQGRNTFETLLRFTEYMSIECNYLLRRSDIMDSLKMENFDLIFLDGNAICGFLVAEKLGKPFMAVLPTTFEMAQFGLPRPLPFVPLICSLLADHMDFWGRIKDVFMFFYLPMKLRQIYSMFDNTVKEHFPEDSRPFLSHLLTKAELYFVNTDFGLEFAGPLHPNSVYIGGLMVKDVKPLPQELEDFIAKFGDSGFVLVALGSMIMHYEAKNLYREMTKAFSSLPQGVIWNYKFTHWPKDVKLPANVKILDWLPQNDLLAHPRIQLFVTHGGLNSVMEAVHHGVPMVGMPISIDQPENLLKVEAKNLGVVIQIKELKAETLALKMKLVIGDKRYKAAAVAASVVKRSQPLTPAQRLVGWTNHILQTDGAAHLKPHAFYQSWYEQYMLDVVLFLLVVTLVALWLCGKLLGLAVFLLCGVKKLKKA